jgi:hypothetical protein
VIGATFDDAFISLNGGVWPPPRRRRRRRRRRGFICE